MATIDQFIASNALRFSYRQVDARKDASDWGPGARHYRATIRKGRPSMMVDYSQGAGITDDPQLADVLDSLASEFAGVDNSRDFADWCSEYGYSDDSRKAERIYRAIIKQRYSLERVIGDDAVQALMYDTERL